MSTPENPTTTAQGRYATLQALRQPFVDRARKCAAVTIPALFPPEGSNGTSDHEDTYQSVGARGINNLASKLTLALLPPGSSFFRLELDDELVNEIAAETQDEGIKAEIDMALALAEKRVHRSLEAGGARISLYESLRQLIVAGNVLLNVLKGGRVRFFRLDSYVVVRDGEGNVLEIIVKEMLDRATVPDKVREILTEVELNKEPVPENAEVELYTRIVRKDNRWQEHQEVEGKIVPDTEGDYPIDRCPWLPLRFARQTGEHYGRSYCDEHLGDLLSCDALASSILDFAAAASKILYLVRPGGETSIEEMVKAVSGEAIEGNRDEVGVLQLEKYADFQVVKATADGVEQRIASAFLLNSSVQRQAERVTAEEIRFVAAELEQALGGLYSILAQELQLPLALLVMAQLQREGTFPNLPKDAVHPTVITGLDALGRESDLMRLDVLLRGIAETFGPQAVVEWVNVGDYITRRAAALGVDSAGLIRSAEEVQQAKQVAMQKDLVEKLGPEAMRAQQVAANPAPSA